MMWPWNFSAKKRQISGVDSVDVNYDGLKEASLGKSTLTPERVLLTIVWEAVGKKNDRFFGDIALWLFEQQFLLYYDNGMMAGQ